MEGYRNHAKPYSMDAESVITDEQWITKEGSSEDTEMLILLITH